MHSHDAGFTCPSRLRQRASPTVWRRPKSWCEVMVASHQDFAWSRSRTEDKIRVEGHEMPTPTHMQPELPFRPSAALGGVTMPRRGASGLQSARGRAYGLLAMVLGSALVAFATAYAISRGTTLGRWLDRTGSGDHLTATGSPAAHEAAATLLETINVATLAVVAVLVVGIALARRGRATAVVIAGAILGACVSAEVLKAGLGRLDPFGWETLRGHPGSFPSGHVTVAVVVTLAALMVCPPRRRRAVALIGGVYSSSVAAAVVLLRWHLPSDALGGALLAVTWMAAAGCMLAGRRIADRGP